MYTASCLCGSCVVEFDNVVGTGLCYCKACKKMTSGLYSSNTIIPTTDFKLKSGNPKTAPHVSDSGSKSTMNFCGDCSSLLWMDYEPRPDWKVLKSGVIDDDDLLNQDALRPKVEQFTARRPPWLCPIADAAQEPGQQAIKKADDMIEELKAGK